MNIWVLYENPKNHDKRWVVRLWITDKATNTFFEADTREECEAHVLENMPGGQWIPAVEGDDPVIVGTWI